MGRRKGNSNPLAVLPSSRVVRARLNEVEREAEALRILLSTVDSVEKSLVGSGIGQ